jgi:hypothetical protein
MKIRWTQEKGLKTEPAFTSLNQLKLLIHHIGLPASVLTSSRTRAFIDVISTDGALKCLYCEGARSSVKE